MAETTGIYICPSCQTLVKGSKDSADGLVCQDCGYEFGSAGDSAVLKKAGIKVPVGRSAGKSTGVIRNLTSKKSIPVRQAESMSSPPVVAKSLESAQVEAGQGGVDEEILMPGESRRVRRRKRRRKDEKNKSLILFLLGWFSVVIIILAMFKLGSRDAGTNQRSDQKTTQQADREARDTSVMKRLMPQITRKFQSFLLQSTMSGRKQFIDKSADLSLIFTRHYENHVFPVPESGKIRRIDQNVLSFLEDDIAIETIWENDKGWKWGAVHVFDKVESWKLDWEVFAPSSTESWAKFRANLGLKEGIFRLLVRKRLSSNEKDSFFVSFYRAPQVFETQNEFKNTQSPEIELTRDSEIGQKFLRLWDNYLEGRSPYGSILAKELDPRGHMRINARLAWEKDEAGDKKMVLKEILGVGWFGKRIQEFHAEELRKATDEATEKLNEDSEKKS